MVPAFYKFGGHVIIITLLVTCLLNKISYLVLELVYPWYAFWSYDFYGICYEKYVIFRKYYFLKAWKHEYTFLKYHWNLNISEILQGMLQVNLYFGNIMDIITTVEILFSHVYDVIKIYYFTNKIKPVWFYSWIII